MRSGGEKNWMIGLALLAAIGLSGCPGDGGGGGGTPPSGSAGTTITGSVTAPNGQLAKAEPGLLQWFASLFVSESHAQAGGLAPVPNTPVLVFQIDNNGNPVTPTGRQTPILAQGTTSTNGSFSVNLPAGTSLAGNIIVQASPTGSPARVCDPSQANCPANQNQLNCPAVGTNLNINPAAELATRQILRRIAQAGANGNLGNYTNQEIGAFITLVQTTVAADPTLIAGNLNDTLNNIRDRVQNLVDDLLPGLETPGEVAPPAAGSATYNFVGFEADNQQNGTLERKVEFGTVVLNSNGTWTFAGQSQGAQLTESCTSSCSRTFTQSAVNRSDTNSGTYVRAGNGRIILTDSSDGSSLVVFTNPSETVVIVPFEEAGGFGIAVKQGSGLSNATAQGNTFNWKEFGSSLRSTQTTNSPWQGPVQTVNGSGTASFTATNVTVNGSDSPMRQQVTCTPTPTGCTLVAQLIQDPPFVTNFTTPFTITPTGSLTMQDTDPGTTGNQGATGEVSADGTVALFAIPQTSGGNVVIATKQGSGLSNASLNGTYNIIAFGEIFTTTGAINTFLNIGTVEFDGIGQQTFRAFNTVRSRSESCPTSGACQIFAGGSAGNTLNETRPYTLTATGTLTITSQTVGTINGFVSPDATFGVTTNAADNVNGISRRFIAVAVKRS